jgi:hypothetical protein
MEGRFGHDFSGVRVHTDARAARSAQELGARAYTVGLDIAFGTQQYAPHTPTGQRLLAHELAHVIQRAPGVARQPVGGQVAEDPAERAAERTATSTQAGGPGSVAVQRQQAPAPTTGGAVTSASPVVFEWIWGIDLTTHAQLAAAARFAIGQVQSDLKEIDPRHPVNTRAEEWIENVEFWLPYLDSMGQNPLTAGTVRIAEQLLETGGKIRGDIAQIKKQAEDAAITRELWRAHDAARAAASEAEKLRPKLDDAMRAAFRAGDEGLLSRVADVAGNVTDIGLGFHELARQTAEKIADLRGVKLAPVGAYVEALDKLNKGLAALNLALSLVGEKATTELEEGMRLIGVAAGAFSSVGTLVGLPAHMGLYANLYLVPATKAILAGITRLTEHLHEENLAWTAAFGRPANFAVEPGGEAMWDFMVAVMRARSVGDIPSIPGQVRDFLVEHRDRLEAGSKEEVPTTGWGFWRELDSPQAREWIFRQRRSLWAMLYGSMQVPRAR